MDETLIDQIEFQAVAPKVALPGLDDTLAKLQAIGSALDGINARLSGLSTHSAFKRTQGGIQDTIKQLQTQGGDHTLKSVSEVLGFDPKDVNQYKIRKEEELNQEIDRVHQRRTALRGKSNDGERKQLLADEKRLQGELSALRRTFEGQELRISGAPSAAKFFATYQRAALKQAKEPIAALQTLFGNPSGSRQQPGPAPVQAPSSAPTVSEATVAAAGGSTRAPRARDLTPEQQLWRNAARQLALSGTALGKVPGKWTEAERAWVTKNVKFAEGSDPNLIQGLMGRIVRAARLLRSSGGEASTGQGGIPLVVPPSRIAATLGPGNVTLVVPPGRIASAAGAGAPPVPPAPPAAGPPPPPQGPSSGAIVPPQPPSGSGPLLEEKITTKPGGKVSNVLRRELIAAGETVDKFFKDVAGALEPVKDVTTRSPLKAARAKLERNIAALKADLAEQLALPEAKRNPATAAAIYRKQAGMIRSLIETERVNPTTGEKEVRPTAAAKELVRLDQQPLISRARSTAASLEQKAAEMDERKQAQMVDDFKRTARMRKELGLARQRGDKEEAARIQDAIRQETQRMEREARDRGRLNAAGQKSADRKAAMQRKLSEQDTLREQGRQYKAASYAAADLRLSDFLSSGGRITSQRNPNELRPGSARTVTAQREAGGQVETLMISYGKAEAAVSRFTKAQSEARKEGGYLAGDFVKNTAKVTLWAASVGVLYKSLELVTHSISQLIEVGPQVGRLEQIFRGLGGTAHQVAVDTMELAAVNGASAQQAMEGAIQWARLGLSRVQINEAVRVSLMAANVAQIDALDATEKLQGVMQAYKLSVGDLRGELGQIVAITNSYNVTTNDMMTGLSRVAAVAKQAGLPLSELHGLLGATIGGTAQSGANIGNMLKSVILALSNPDLQNKLRMDFKFESTTGGEEIKGMSSLLADLFVKFQHLNQLQQQSMLFSVAGRTQASRLQAMLEGYVKAQVLAVNAQLHLNTAEQENTKITATLRAQLQGVSAEWERFIFIQGNRGPVQAMVEMSTALRNVLKLMSTPIGSGATTGILGLLTAGGIKSIITGMSLSGGQGFLSRSGAHVRSALGDFNNSMTAVYAGALQGGLASDVGSRKQKVIGSRRPDRSLFDPLGPELFAIDKKMYVWSEAMLRVGRSSAVSSAAVRGMATALGAVTRALSVGFIALRQFLLPIAVVSLGFMAFNKVMEDIGVSSEKAERKLAGLNDETQRAAAAANAYAEAAQAISTIERAIQPERGFKATEPDTQKRLIEQSSDLVGLYEPDLTKQEAIQRAYKTQVELLRQQGNIGGILNLMEAERTKLAEKRQEELQKEFVSIQAQRRAAYADIKRLQEIDKTWMGHFGRDTRAENIKRRQKEAQDLSMSSTRNIVEQTDAYEQQLQYDEKYKSSLRTQKLLWESIGEIYSSVNANNPLEKSQLKIASLQAEDQAIERHLQLLDEEDKLDIEGRAAIDQRKSQLKAEELAAREELATWEAVKAIKENPKQRVSHNPDRAKAKAEEEMAFINSDEAIERNIREKKEAIEVNELQVKRTDEGFGVGQEGLGFARRASLRSIDTEKRKENRAEIEAQTRTMPVAELRTRMEFGQQEARRETAPFSVGRDETQKLQNLQEGIRRVMMGLQEMPQSAEVLSREIDLQNQRYESQIELRRRSFQVEREILQLQIDQRKEMEHSLLSAGPAELLRKMAAIRMGDGGKMGIGQFLSLTPEMRRDVAMVDTRFDPRMMDLQRERRRYKRDSQEDFDNGLRATSADKQGMVDRVAKNVPELSTFNAAAKVVNDFAGELSLAVSAVRSFREEIKSVKAAPSSGQQSAAVGGAPSNAQSGGLGAGAGFRSAIMRGGD